MTVLYLVGILGIDETQVGMKAENSIKGAKFYLNFNFSFFGLVSLKVK